MLCVEFAENPCCSPGDSRALGLVVEIVTANSRQVGEVPPNGDIGLSGDVDVGPGFDVCHAGLDEKALVMDGLEVAEAEYANPERADADPASLQGPGRETQGLRERNGSDHQIEAVAEPLGLDPETVELSSVGPEVLVPDAEQRECGADRLTQPLLENITVILIEVFD
jgi:hypothetical protein